MKKLLTIAALITSFIGLQAQNAESYLSTSAIQTAVPFLIVNPDARSGGMGEVQVASSPDSYSHFSNPAKYLFLEYENGFSLNFTPWLGNLTNDMFMGNFNYYHRIWDRGFISAGFRIFSLGKVEKTEYALEQITRLGEFSPLEFSFDVAYSMLLTPEFAMGVNLRYIRSDITDKTSEETAQFKAGNAVGVDINGFFNKAYDFAYFSAKLRFGFNLSNIGNSMTYGVEDLDKVNRIPTNLALGVGWDFDIDPMNRLSLQFETNKLLVPTPEEGPNGTYKVPQSGVALGIIQSLYKHPDGFGAKLGEFSAQFGTEYSYNDMIKVRLGWARRGSSNQGENSYLTTGFGFRYSVANLDFSYLLPTGKETWLNPLANTIRVSLTIDFGRRWIL